MVPTWSSTATRHYIGRPVRQQHIACNGANMVLDNDYIGRLVADIGLLDVLDCHRDPSSMAGRCRFGSRPGYCREDIVGGQGPRFFVVDAVTSPVSNSESKTSQSLRRSLRLPKALRRSGQRLLRRLDEVDRS